MLDTMELLQAEFMLFLFSFMVLEDIDAAENLLIEQ
jgi:hypothetical protein